jgi:hypothetical protein
LIDDNRPALTNESFIGGNRLLNTVDHVPSQYALRMCAAGNDDCAYYDGQNNDVRGKAQQSCFSPIACS